MGLPVDAAEHLANSKLDPGTQALLNELADKCAAGTLSESERVEYLDLVEAIDFLSIFQAKARAATDQRSER